MGVHRARVAKSRAAELAHVRPFAGVRAYMRTQYFVRHEPASAMFADFIARQLFFLVFKLHVSSERERRIEDLIANRALVIGFELQMCRFYVLSQEALRGVSL